jgi:hypothetical protein
MPPVPSVVRPSRRGIFICIHALESCIFLLIPAIAGTQVGSCATKNPQPAIAKKGRSQKRMTESGGNKVSLGMG